MPESIKNNRKTVALALSGCAARAIAYIGMLEVFEENGVPVDMIAACSSGALVASAYASGTLSKLKEKAFTMTSKELFALFAPSFKGGLFSLDKLDDIYGEFLSVENLEELKIPTAIVASDIIEGKEVVFRIGNIMRAIKASCSMPGVFEPVVWGGKVLVDGGLFSIVPVEAARGMNPDIIIGIDMAESRHLESGALHIKAAYNYFKRPFAKLHLPASVREFMFGKTDVIDYATIDEIKTPSLMTVLGKAMDYAIEERKKGEFFNCDLMITPEVHSYDKISTTDFRQIYETGRVAAQAALPKIQKLLSDLNA